MITYVALLRGINVGGNNIVSMSALKTCIESLGYENVTTYINSGNVIFRTVKNNPRTLEATIETALATTFGFPITVVVRSLPEIHDTIAHLPASWHNPEGQRCNVIFLRHSIDNLSSLKGLAAKPGIEELHYHQGVLFWSAQTSDLTKSNMIKLASQSVYQQMTIRGLKTVRKLYDIMRANA